MTPSSLATLLGFLFFVAPGLLADLLEARRRAGTKESSFREVGRVALFSLFCSAVGAALVGYLLVRLQGRTGFDPLRAVKDTDYSNDHFWWSVVAVGLASVIGCAVAVAIQRWRLGPLRRRVQQTSAWSRTFEVKHQHGKGVFSRLSRRLKGTAVNRFLDRFRAEPVPGRIVKVEMMGGEQYVGVVAGFTPNLELADRELTLKQALWVQRDTAAAPTRVPEEWEHLVLRGDQIKTVTVQKHVSPAASD